MEHIHMDHIRDIEEIDKYGIMGTLELVINSHHRRVGGVFPKTKLIE